MRSFASSSSGDSRVICIFLFYYYRYVEIRILDAHCYVETQIFWMDNTSTHSSAHDTSHLSTAL